MEVSYLIECEVDESYECGDDHLRRNIQNELFHCAVQSQITIHMSNTLISDIQGVQEELLDHYSYIFEKTEEAIKKDVEERKTKGSNKSDSQFETSFKVTALIAVEVNEAYIDPWTSDLAWNFYPIDSPFYGKTAVKPGYVTGFYLPKKVIDQNSLEKNSKIQINIFYCNTEHSHCNQ